MLLTPPPARIIPSERAGSAVPVASAPAALEDRALAPPPRARILARQVAEARAEAARILEAARAQAQQIVERAEVTSKDLSVQHQARARADALALIVAHALTLEKREKELAESMLERSVGFATLLAERLLGEELEQRPERVRALARQALKEAAGARHALISANPRDAAELRSGLEGVAPLLDSVEIEDDPELSRGQLRVETEIGIIEADIRGQLDRLSAQLRRLLESHAPARS